MTKEILNRRAALLRMGTVAVAAYAVPTIATIATAHASGGSSTGPDTSGTSGGADTSGTSGGADTSGSDTTGSTAGSETSNSRRRQNRKGRTLKDMLFPK